MNDERDGRRRNRKYRYSTSVLAAILSNRPLLRNAKLLHAFAFLNGRQWSEKWYRLEESPLQRTLHDDYREEKKYARINAANERLSDAAATMSTQSHVRSVSTRGQQLTDLMEEE
ncbi:hypothetical protein M9458_034533, partial [Cirrhinus mrigala]